MLTCRQVTNKPIITGDGRILGKVASVIVDEEWKIPLISFYLERALAERFNVRRPFLGNPRAFLEPQEISALSDNVVLKKRLADLRERLKERAKGMEASKLLDKKVKGEEGYYFGDLEDMTVDQARWRVLELVVEVRKKAADEMGFPMTLFGTCQAKVPVKRVEALRDHIILSIGPEVFRDYIVKQRQRE